MAAERVFPARLGRFAVAEQVGRDDRETLAQDRRDVRPQVAELPAIPWTSSSTGPVPEV
jgi:hypothetical protein